MRATTPSETMRSSPMIAAGGYRLQHIGDFFGIHRSRVSKIAQAAGAARHAVKEKPYVTHVTHDPKKLPATRAGGCQSTEGEWLSDADDAVAILRGG